MFQRGCRPCLAVYASPRSPYEFNTFVRTKLQLNTWAVRNKDLDEFYAELDTDGDGLEVEELIAYPPRCTGDRQESQWYQVEDGFCGSWGDIE